MKNGIDEKNWSSKNNAIAQAHQRLLSWCNKTTFCFEIDFRGEDTKIQFFFSRHVLVHMHIAKILLHLTFAK